MSSLPTRTRIKELLASPTLNENALVMGWVRTFRSGRFITLNDGSCLHSLQVVVDDSVLDEHEKKCISTGASLAVHGKMVASIGSGQEVEMQATKIEILGTAENYPLQPKRHSLEYLREVGHLRMRTNTFGAVFRVRSALAFAVHTFFRERDFVYLHTPIITAVDAEGAGEMFSVTNFDLHSIDTIPHDKKTREVDFSQDFFARRASLTVSGQIEGELGMSAFGDIYTFGPTFRAENSNTARHLAEFWMIEPEMAFCDLAGDMRLAESFLKYLIAYVLDNCADDLAFLEKRLSEEEKTKPMRDRSEMGLIEKLQFCITQPFTHATYSEAIDILTRAAQQKKNLFQYAPSWGADLQSEHERFLVEKHFKCPTIITDYPREIKAFYMRENTDGKTVAAMDVLFPAIGEIIGGSQREERLNKLVQRMEEMHISTQAMDWYLDTRRYGTCPHAGFGLGFDRLVQFATGMGNIRDVIPFARTPRNIAF